MSTIKQRQVDGLTAALAGKAATGTQVIAGTGLTGGGDLSTSRTFNLAGKAASLFSLATTGIIVASDATTIVSRSIAVTSTARLTIANADGVSGNPTLDLATVSGLTPGTFTKVTVDAYGRVTDGVSPTTLSGYGITDALPLGGGTLTGGLQFSNSLGVANPTFTSRSAGTRIVLRDTLTGSAVDFAIGFNTNKLWFSVAAASGTYSYGWYAGTTQVMTLTGAGNLTITGDFAAATKSFLIPHPTRKDWTLRHASLEGPEHTVFFRGRGRSNKIVLPRYWRNLVDPESVTVHLTSRTGQHRLWVMHADNREVVIAKYGDPEFDYDFIVYGTRRDVPALVVEEKKKRV